MPKQLPDLNELTNITDLDIMLIRDTEGLVDYKVKVETVSDYVNSKILSGLGIVNVKDFGAVGDGVTDDLAACQAAIDSSGAKVIYFPPGTYLFESDWLRPKSNQILYGFKGASYLKQSINNPERHIIVLQELTNTHLKDLSFTGVSYFGQASFPGNGTSFWFRGCSECSAMGITTFGTAGIWVGEDNTAAGLKGSTDIVFDDIYVEECNLFSLYIRGIEVYAGGGTKAEVTTQRINVSNLTVKNSNVGFVTADGRPRDINLINYHCENSDTLIQIEDTDNINITNFILRDSTSNFSANSPTPFKNLALLCAGCKGVKYVNGNISETETQCFGFPAGNLNSGLKFVNVDWDATSNVVFLNSQPGSPDTFKNAFADVKFVACTFLKNNLAIYQFSTADQTNPAWILDLEFIGCEAIQTTSTGNNFWQLQNVVNLSINGGSWKGIIPRSMQANKILISGASFVNGAPLSSSPQWTAIDVGDPARPPMMSIDGGTDIYITKDLKLDASSLGRINIGSCNIGTNTADISTAALIIQNAIGFSESGATFTTTDRLKQISFTNVTSNTIRRLPGVTVQSAGNPNTLAAVPEYRGQLFRNTTNGTTFVNTDFTATGWLNIPRDFMGRIAAAGTASYLPTGWTVSKPSAGTYTVTHNLGLSDYDVTVTPVDTVAKIPFVSTYQSNSFTVVVTNTAGTATDTAFAFHLKVRP